VVGEVPLPAERRHLGGHRRGRRAPATSIGEPDVFLGRRPERQKAAGVALPSAPVSGNSAPVDQHDPRWFQAGSRKRASLGGDGDSLRSRTNNGQGRHHMSFNRSSRAWWTATVTALESDEVDAGERVVDLLHRTAGGEIAEVDHGEARILEEREDGRFRIVVVAADEDDALTVGLMRV